MIVDYRGHIVGSQEYDRPPYRHDEYRRELTERQIRLLQDRGGWVRPTGA